MDPEKLVCTASNLDSAPSHANLSQKEIASQGGHASSGSFEPGSERAAEAGRKGAATLAARRDEMWGEFYREQEKEA
jgi:hypothetical protein